MKRRINYNLLTAEELAFYQACNRKYGTLVNQSGSSIQRAIDELTASGTLTAIAADLIKYLDLRLRITVG